MYRSVCSTLAYAPPRLFLKFNLSVTMCTSNLCNVPPGGWEDGSRSTGDNRRQMGKKKMEKLLFHLQRFFFSQTPSLTVGRLSQPFSTCLIYLVSFVVTSFFPLQPPKRRIEWEAVFVFCIDLYVFSSIKIPEESHLFLFNIFFNIWKALFFQTSVLIKMVEIIIFTSKEKALPKLGTAGEWRYKLQGDRILTFGFYHLF